MGPCAIRIQPREDIQLSCIPYRIEAEVRRETERAQDISYGSTHQVGERARCTYAGIHTVSNTGGSGLSPFFSALFSHQRAEAVGRRRLVFYELLRVQQWRVRGSLRFHRQEHNNETEESRRTSLLLLTPFSPGS